MKVYQEIARSYKAFRNCRESGNAEWEEKHYDKMNEITKRYMPSGSGFDAGTGLMVDDCTENELRFVSQYHKMNDGGYYDGWIGFNIIVKPSLSFDFDMEIEYEGEIDEEDKMMVEDYIMDSFHNALNEEVAI